MVKHIIYIHTGIVIGITYLYHFIGPVVIKQLTKTNANH
jgi:hypothetical protein